MPRIRRSERARLGPSRTRPATESTPPGTTDPGMANLRVSRSDGPGSTHTTPGAAKWRSQIALFRSLSPTLQRALAWIGTFSPKGEKVPNGRMRGLTRPSAHRTAIEIHYRGGADLCVRSSGHPTANPRPNGQPNRSGRKSNPRPSAHPDEWGHNQPRVSADLCVYSPLSLLDSLGPRPPDLCVRPLLIHPQRPAPMGRGRVGAANAPRHSIQTSRPAKPKPAPRGGGPPCPLHWARIRKPAPRWAANALRPNTPLVRHPKDTAPSPTRRHPFNQPRET